MQNTDRMIRLKVQIDHDTHARLKRLSAATGDSIAAYVRGMIAATIDQAERRYLPKPPVNPALSPDTIPE